VSAARIEAQLDAKASEKNRKLKGSLVVDVEANNERKTETEKCTDLDTVCRLLAHHEPRPYANEIGPV
jgi:hypothetical protein